jgi:hypothetical protein
MRLSLAQGFGDSSNQSADWLEISKSDLASVGLTPSTNNTAESLLAAMLLLMRRNFEGSVDSNLGVLTSDKGVPITYDQSPLYELLGVRFWRSSFDKGKRINTFIVNCYLPSATIYDTFIDPNI